MRLTNANRGRSADCRARNASKVGSIQAETAPSGTSPSKRPRRARRIVLQAPGCRWTAVASESVSCRTERPAVDPRRAASPRAWGRTGSPRRNGSCQPPQYASSNPSVRPWAFPRWGFDERETERYPSGRSSEGMVGTSGGSIGRPRACTPCCHGESPVSRLACEGTVQGAGANAAEKETDSRCIRSRNGSPGTASSPPGASERRTVSRTTTTMSGGRRSVTAPGPLPAPSPGVVPWGACADASEGASLRDWGVRSADASRIGSLQRPKQRVPFSRPGRKRGGRPASPFPCRQDPAPGGRPGLRELDPRDRIEVAEVGAEGGRPLGEGLVDHVRYPLEVGGKDRGDGPAQEAPGRRIFDRADVLEPSVPHGAGPPTDPVHVAVIVAGEAERDVGAGQGLNDQGEVLPSVDAAHCRDIGGRVGRPLPRYPVAGMEDHRNDLQARSKGREQTGDVPLLRPGKEEDPVGGLEAPRHPCPVEQPASDVAGRRGPPPGPQGVEPDDRQERPMSEHSYPGPRTGGAVPPPPQRPTVDPLEQDPVGPGGAGLGGGGPEVDRVAPGLQGGLEVLSVAFDPASDRSVERGHDRDPHPELRERKRRTRPTARIPLPTASSTRDPTNPGS